MATTSARLMSLCPLRRQRGLLRCRVTQMQEPIPIRVRLAAEQLRHGILAELRRREGGQGAPEWIRFDIPFLEQLARNADLVATGVANTVGNCPWCGLPYRLMPPGRWCCLNVHCLPA